ncbi:hypothetical protein ES707_00846 [subsurface metagenome]
MIKKWFKYYFDDIKTFSLKVLTKKILYKVKIKILSAVDRISIKTIGVEITDTEFLRKAWNSRYKFQNLEELRKYFHNRRKPEFFIVGIFLLSLATIHNNVLAGRGYP